MKPSNSNSSHNHQRFGTSLMRKLKRCFSCYKPTEPRSKEKYKGKMSCNLSEKTSRGDDGVPKGLRIEDVLVRIVVLLLIRDKVKAASEKPGTPLFPDDIVSRFPGLKSGRFWKEHHDLLLCVELNLPVVTLPVPGASQSQDGTNVVSAETPMNETKGTVGNNLAVDAANRAPDVANRSQLFQDSSSLYHYREMQRRQEEKELVSRDGQAKLKANVFFASFDQCSDKATGESACTALAAVIANWLQSNLDNMPTRAQFDRLIVEGSSKWRKLSDNQDLINQFPDKDFDIETVLQARLCPISVLHENSFIRFFGPKKFETLKGVMSFDQIWDEIKKNAEDDNDMPRIYIARWNDHFFVLKVDVNAYYIIDTFGERLFEGCNQAYILRFDDSA
ncbi:hypothetical protein ACSBR1_037435 [Camellia fascicularis]